MKPAIKSIVILFFILFFLTDIFVSLWFFSLSFRKGLLEKYYSMKYSYLPKSEYATGIKYKISSDNPNNIGTYGGKIITLNNVETTVVYPNGTTNKIYQGKVVALPIAEWEGKIPIERNHMQNEISVNIDQREIAIERNGQYKIISVPSNVRIKKRIYNNLVRSAQSVQYTYKNISLYEITVGDNIYFDTGYEQLTVMTNFQQN